MSVVITGATGHLGRLVVENLLQQGVPARDITAAVQNAQRRYGLSFVAEEAL